MKTRILACTLGMVRGLNAAAYTLESCWYCTGCVLIGTPKGYKVPLNPTA